MELKLNLWMLSEKPLRSLNRTFYGIETCLVGGIGHQSDVLIVPFMELKPSEEKAQKKVAKGLNRTFYGIETGMRVIIISRLMMS